MRNIIKLSYPPSINHYYKNGRNGIKYIGDQGRKYRIEALAVVRGLALASFGDSPVAVTVLLHQKDKRKRDVDNCQKCLFDALTHAGVWNDDGQVYELTIKKGDSDGVWIDSDKKGYCEVFIARIGDK